MSKCVICGYEIQPGEGYFATPKGDVCSSECHTEAFWLQKVDWAEDCQTEEGEPVFRANGQHYVISAEDDGSFFKGHSGRLFYVYYHLGPFAGKIIRTTNLWSQGEVPEGFQNELYDNASLMSADQYTRFVAEGKLKDVPVVVFRNFVDGKYRTGQWAETRLVEVNK